MNLVFKKHIHCNKPAYWTGRAYTYFVLSIGTDLFGRKLYSNLTEVISIPELLRKFRLEDTIGFKII